MRLALSSPTNAVPPFTLETNRPRYLVMVERSAAELVSDVAAPQVVEMFANVPAVPVEEFFSTRIVECANVVFTHALIVEVVELNPVNMGSKL